LVAWLVLIGSSQILLKRSAHIDHYRNAKAKACHRLAVVTEKDRFERRRAEEVARRRLLRRRLKGPSAQNT